MYLFLPNFFYQQNVYHTSNDKFVGKRGLFSKIETSVLKLKVYILVKSNIKFVPQSHAFFFFFFYFAFL